MAAVKVSPAGRVSIGAQDAHVWLTQPDSIRDAALLERYFALLGPEEQARHARYLFDKDKHLFLVAHALVRCTLSRYDARAPSDWTFVIGAHGRPEIAPGTCELPLRFNLSHTPGLVACAVTLGRDVGVDVEWMDRRSETVSIADRFFSADEVRDLQALPVDRRRDGFFRYWTLKESYIKARGMGLAIPLHHFSFVFDQAAPGEHGPAAKPHIGIRFDEQLSDAPERWQFALSQLDSRHMLALALERTEPHAPDVSYEVSATVPLIG